MAQGPEIRQRMKLEQQVNVIMLQTLSMLQLTNVDLAAAVQEIVLGNPLLEWNPNHQYKESQWKTIDTIDALKQEDTRDAKDILQEEISFQPWDEETKARANLLVNSADEKGFLGEDYESWLDWAGIAAKDMEPVVDFLQRLAPGFPGSSLRETLSNQVEKEEFLYTLIQNDLEAIANGSYDEIAQKYDVSPDIIQQQVQKMQNLHPYPFFGLGRFGQREKRLPDVIVEYKEHWNVTLADDILGSIDVNLHALDHFLGTKDVDEFIRNKKREAEHLLFSIEERNKTFLHCTTALVLAQESYLLGFTKEPRPLLQKELAKRLNLHPSTISRAVRDKFMRAPRGLVAMESLFPKTVGKETAIAPKVLMRMIERLLKEDPGVSDRVLAEKLQKRGYPIARRTVNKYRNRLKKKYLYFDE